MQSEIRKIIGYDVETTLLNEKGREYLKEATNPGAILAVQGVLIVASDNKTFNQDTINSIQYIIRASSITYSEDLYSRIKKTEENVKIKS